MPGGGGAIISDNNLIYSIQRTYIIKPVFHPKFIFTCDERIDIPTVEPLTYVDPVVYPGHRPNVVPCIEITVKGMDLDGINLTFETNEGVTVLPVKIASGTQNPLGNPYTDNRYVLVLPRGTTGIETCKIIVPEIGEFQHNFTFGIMPPPYNYDNALFGCISGRVVNNSNRITALEKVASHYGYATQKAEHTIDFSDFGDAFTIAPDTRFLTFSVTNPLETPTFMNIVLTSNTDSSNSVIAPCQVAPGQNNVKVDLQVLAVFIVNDKANKADSYIIPPMQDRRYGGIRFSHNRNTNLPGSVQVTEWA